MADIVNEILVALGEAILSLLKWLALFIIDNSYWICLFVVLAALLLYLAGIKKYGKWALPALAIYYILQCFKVVL